MSIQFKQSLILGACLMSSSWSFAAVKEYQLVIDESPIFFHESFQWNQSHIAL